MKNLWTRLTALALCLLMLIPCLPLQSLAVDANDVIPQAHYGSYSTLATIYNQGDCFSMQGMTLDTNYTYCAKVNTDTDASACIIRTSKSTGAKTVMINSATGGYYFSNLGHANSLDTTWINGCGQLLVTAGTKLVRLTMSGSYLTTAGTYTASYNGSSMSMTAVQVMWASEEHVQILVKTGRTLYTGTFTPTATSGNIELTKLCTLNISSARLKEGTYDFSSYLQQGMDYYDGKLFLPLSGDTQADTSVVLVYDLEGASGELKNDPSLSFRVISSTYAALFEIEDVAICQETGRLYFNTNRRKSSSDTNYDSCSYFDGYVYDPAMSTTTSANYRWETVNNKLISVPQGGNTFSTPTQFHGTIDNNELTHCIWSLSRSVKLMHDEPWVVEWKSSGDFYGGAMLLATGQHSKVTNAPYLYRQEAGMIALGYYSGTQYNNYGVKVSDYGIDPTDEHVYRMTNKIAADGSNMVWLSVDGTELGAMNRHHIGGTYQKVDASWINGRDFTFSYIGCYHYPLSTCKLDYLQVWAQGVPDEPQDYRWESISDDLTAVTGGNNTTIYTGSVSGVTYTSAAFRLDKTLELLHDRPWSVEWLSVGALSGGTFLLSAAEGGATEQAPYLFRYGNDFIALGRREGSIHRNSGILLSDHGIDGTAKHLYRLTNKIAADGSNMVWLYVDNVEVGPLNNAYQGTNSQGTTDNWLSGKDFVFDYIGNSQYPMKGTYSYLAVSEEGPECTITFRDYNGTILATVPCPLGQVPTPPADPVKAADSKYSYTFTGWSPELTAATGDADYVATYSQTLQSYTVTFKNEDGTVLQSQQLTYGTVPTPPANPTKEGTASIDYVFAGWDKTVTKVTGDATYIATYTETPASVTVTFRNDDGTVLSTQVLEYGQTPVAPAAPSKAATASHSYTFTGWDSAIVAATKDTVYTARYASSLRKYTVTFVNYDGTVLSTQLIPYGYTPTAPSTVPTRNADVNSHYSFKGWTPALEAISGATTYTASYISTAHGFKSVTAPPTCTTTGTLTQTCSSCGYVKRDPIPATGHSYSSRVTTPTCTAAGYTTYTCTACGHSYTGNSVAAKGHSYVNGTCTVCGAADPNYTPAVIQPVFQLRYPTLTFEDVITMNIYFEASDLEDVVEMGLITYKREVTDWNVNNAEAVIPGYYEASGMYVASTEGIPAKDMGDTYWFAVYAKLTDGSYTYTRLVSYSPAMYAYGQLSDPEMTRLVVAMLNYGAAAQTYFNYRTDSLMNADLTAAQKASIEPYRADMMDPMVSVDSSKVGIFTNSGGFSKRYPTITFDGAFSIDYFFTPSSTPSGNVKLYYWTQEAYNNATTLSPANASGCLIMTNDGTGVYEATVEGIAAKDLDKTIYVCGGYMSGGTSYCSGVLAYSIGTYCVSQAATTGTMSPFAQATAVYGYYAKELFY